MLPVCSAAPCCSSFHHITYVGSRMVYRLRQLSEDRFFIDERQGLFAYNCSRVQDMSFKTKATKFIYSPAVETPDLSAFRDPSTFPPYPNSFDDIVRGFPNENIDEHENWSCLANEINRSCPLADDLKYVADSDMPRLYALNCELEGEYLYGINHGSTSLEALALQNINLSTVADSKVDEVAISRDFLDQSLSGQCNLASDTVPGTLPGRRVMIPDMLEVASKESSYLKENFGSFVSGTEESVDKLLNRAANSVTSTVDLWKLSLSDTVKGATENYDSAVSILFSSVDNTKGQASYQLTGFSVKLEESIYMTGAVVIDILRWIIIGVKDGISNGVTFVVYNYASAKSFLPPDIRNALNMFKDYVTQSLSPIGGTFQKVFEAIEEIERNLGLDPNDPLVPFLLLIGTTITVGILYRLFSYDWYSLSPEKSSELLKNDKNVLLVDVRPEARNLSDPLFIDPYAECLVSSEVGSPGKERQQRTLLSSLYYRLATKFIDDKILDEIRSLQELRQIVLLTDGMDTRPYRLKWPTSTVIYDISPEPVFKEAYGKLQGSGAKLSKTCIMIHASLESSDLQTLLQRKGFNRYKPSLWVLQGLPLPTLSGFEDMLSTVSSLAIKGCLFIGELPGCLLSPELDNKLTTQRLMTKLFLNHGFRVSIVNYNELARNVHGGPKGNPLNVLFVARQLRLSDAQMEVWRSHVERLDEEGDEEGFEEL